MVDAASPSLPPAATGKACTAPAVAELPADFKVLCNRRRETYDQGEMGWPAVDAVLSDSSLWALNLFPNNEVVKCFT
jgi:hypothetical protein